MKTPPISSIVSQGRDHLTRHNCPPHNWALLFETRIHNSFEKRNEDDDQQRVDDWHLIRFDRVKPDVTAHPGSLESPTRSLKILLLWFKKNLFVITKIWTHKLIASSYCWDIAFLTGITIPLTGPFAPTSSQYWGGAVQQISKRLTWSTATLPRAHTSIRVGVQQLTGSQSYQNNLGACALVRWVRLALEWMERSWDFGQFYLG